MEVVVKFIRESTVWIRTYVYDSDDALADPTSITITIVDPDGTTQVDEADVTTNPSTGIYDYYYTTESDATEGWWQGEITAVDGAGDTAKYSKESFSFKVKAGL